MTLLKVSNLSHQFRGLKAVSELSFEVARGEILGLIGPNGAGKTTVVNLISGVLRPRSGKVELADADVTGLSPHRLAQLGLARTFQSTVVYGSRTVYENALRGAFLQLYPGFMHCFLGTARARSMRQEADAHVAQLLEWLDLNSLANNIAGSLPYGYQKLLGIVIALAVQPTCILLDEPVAGLSAEESNHVRDAILRVRERGITVVVIDHNMRFISGLCDRVVVMHHGQELAQGVPREVLSDPRVIEAYLGRSHGAARRK